jgi:hypothetical protein
MRMQGTIDFTITERTAERVLAEMPVTTGILNPFDVAHAGAMLSSVRRVIERVFADHRFAIELHGDQLRAESREGALT